MSEQRIPLLIASGGLLCLLLQLVLSMTDSPAPVSYTHLTADSRFLIYRLGEEVKDPDTLESLGNLEIAIGIGKPKHIQDKLTTVVPSEMKRTVQKYEKFVAQLMGVEERTAETPILFDAPKVGDLVRIVQ